ncbi:MAG TPA: oxidoreductase [Chitinophagales bacterium]|nr:oxidoreductase [Chitinophagales bacterium]
MQNRKRSALLAGASGLIGGHCLNFLLNEAAYDSVSLVVRKEMPLIHPKLRQHSINFDRLIDYSSILKGDDVFCCLGTTIKKAGSQSNFKKVDLEYPVEIARLALANGAKQLLIVTALGANKSSLIFYNRVKGEVEDAVKKLSYNAIHIFRPSLLLGERKEYRAGEKIGTALYRIASPLFIGPLKKYKAIEGKAVAAAMVDCAKRNGRGVFIYESEEIQRIYDRQPKTRGS